MNKPYQLEDRTPVSDDILHYLKKEDKSILKSHRQWLRFIRVLEKELCEYHGLKYFQNCYGSPEFINIHRISISII